MEPPSAETPHPISFYTFLFPTSHLKASGAEFNPFLLRFGFRRKRVLRFVALRAMEVVLILITLAVLLGNLEPSAGFGMLGIPIDLWVGVSGVVFNFSVYTLWVFLMLRYNLALHDRAGILKSLQPENLPELYLARLSNETLFLDLFCQFCRRFELLVGFMACFLVTFTLEVFSPRADWIEPWYWTHVIYAVFTTLGVWVVSAFQYTLEWRWFAGKPARPHRFVISLFLGLVFPALAAVISLIFSHTNFYPGGGEFFVLLLLGITVLSLSAYSVYTLGMATNSTARERLFRDLLSDDPDNVAHVAGLVPGRRLKRHALFPFAGGARLRAACYREQVAPEFPKWSLVVPPLLGAVAGFMALLLVDPRFLIKYGGFAPKIEITAGTLILVVLFLFSLAGSRWFVRGASPLQGWLRVVVATRTASLAALVGGSALFLRDLTARHGVFDLMSLHPGATAAILGINLYVALDLWLRLLTIIPILFLSQHLILARVPWSFLKAVIATGLVTFLVLFIDLLTTALVRTFVMDLFGDFMVQFFTAMIFHFFLVLCGFHVAFRFARLLPSLVERSKT